MHVSQRRFLQQRHKSELWHGHSESGRLTVRDITLTGFEIRGWSPLRVQRYEAEDPPVTRSLWSRRETNEELLSIELFVCRSVKAAHDQILVALGNMQSDAIERTIEGPLGDVAFTLDDTLALFARANVVALVRNAGPSVVHVKGIARQLDGLIKDRLEAAR